jgi:stearoyl-CoA desaturase (delta-9 desaturase)
MTQHPVFWTFLFLIMHWYTSLAFQSLFHHRTAAHGMIELKKWQIKLFFILSNIAMGSSYLSPRSYGILHRLHHRYADTAEDPHSPLNFKNLFHMMWQTKKVYMSIEDEKHVLKEKDLYMLDDLPEWKKFDKFVGSWEVRVAWAVVYVCIYWLIGTPWFLYPLLLIHVLTGPIHGALVNWYAHKYGTSPHKTGDTSKNLPWYIAILVPGEAYHNNHHADHKKARFGFWDIYYFIGKCFFLKFKKTKVKKTLTV